MATFGPARAEPANGLEDSTSSVSVRFLDSIVKRYLDSLPPLIRKLDQHRENIIQFARNGDKRNLRAELISASTTIKQGQSVQRNFSKTCTSIPEDVLKKYEVRLKQSHNDLQQALEALKHSQQRAALDRQISTGLPLRLASGHLVPSPVQAQSSAPVSYHKAFEDSVGNISVSLPNDEQLEYEERSLEREREAWQTVCSDLEELNGIIQVFSSAVHDQQQLVDNIANHIDHASANVQKGTRTLGKAGGYRAAILPVAGAAIGAALGGPIGLFAGLKLGALVSAGVAGAGGAYVGKKLKEKKNDQISEELSGLTQQ